MEERFQVCTNPMDNDTDGDMLPDWYEYEKDGMNPTITSSRLRLKFSGLTSTGENVLLNCFL